MIGTIVGLRWLSQTTTRYMLAVILGAAGLQLLFFWRTDPFNDDASRDQLSRWQRRCFN
jgi:hypothetical protein